MIALVSKLEPISGNGNGSNSPVADSTKRLLVQGNGEIFVPQVGPIRVGGLTLDTARRVIFDRLVENKLDFDFGVEIVEFGSQKVAVSGVDGAQLLPITVRPLTLREAIAAVGGLRPDPENTVIRVLRQGSIYEIPATNFLESSDLANRVLIDGDAVYVSTLYDVERALTYFEQQLKLQDIRRQQREDARAQLDYEIARETYRLEAERLRQETTLARFQAQREAQTASESARIENQRGRQEYLDRLRALQEANRMATRNVEKERRETLRANASERARERSERRALLELELKEERARLEQLAEQREQARALFEKRVSLGAIERDYVTIAGETNAQSTFPLPFDGRVTLNRVLYEAGGGPNVISGDTSEIYVIRRPLAGAKAERLVAYHLDASNASNLAVATAFEMRPHDVVFINPQPVTNWNRVLAQLLPSTSFLFGTAAGVSGLGSN